MQEKKAPDISHLSSDDLVKIIRESAAGDIERQKALVKDFMERADDIARMDAANVEKVAKLVEAFSSGGDGSCSSASAGCC